MGNGGQTPINLVLIARRSRHAVSLGYIVCSELRIFHEGWSHISKALLSNLASCQFSGHIQCHAPKLSKSSFPPKKLGRNWGQIPINFWSCSSREHTWLTVCCIFCGTVFSATIRRYECFSHPSQHTNRYSCIRRARSTRLPNAKSNLVRQPRARHRA